MVKVTREIELRYFNWSSGAKVVADKVEDDEWDTLESNINELYPDGIDDETLDDIFDYDADTIAEWLGFSSWDAMFHRYDEEEEEEEDEEEEVEEEEEEE